VKTPKEIESVPVSKVRIGILKFKGLAVQQVGVAATGLAPVSTEKICSKLELDPTKLTCHVLEKKFK
jgi:hypothetical protein